MSDYSKYVLFAADGTQSVWKMFIFSLRSMASPGRLSIGKMDLCPN